MAQLIMCDVCTETPAAVLVTILEGGDVTAVCPTCGPPALHTLADILAGVPVGPEPAPDTAPQAAERATEAAGGQGADTGRRGRHRPQEEPPAASTGDQAQRTAAAHS